MTTLLLVLHAETAGAAPRLHSLRGVVHVRPGATCIDEEALREQVRAWLDADTVEGDLRVEVDGSGSDARFVVFRIWDGGRLIARRSFAPGPAECAQMHAVVGLAIALAVKVSLRDELFGEPPPRSSGAWSLGAAASGAWDVVPGAAGGAVVWLEKAFPEPFAVHLGVSALAAGSSRFERAAGAFTTWSVALEAAACAVPILTRGVHGRFCAGLEARTLFASGSGFAISRDTVLDWFSLVNSLGISVAIAPRWSLVGTIGLVAPLANVQIAVVDPGGRVVETRELAPAGGLISLGGAHEF